MVKSRMVVLLFLVSEIYPFENHKKIFYRSKLVFMKLYRNVYQIKTLCCIQLGFISFLSYRTLIVF